MKRCKARKRDGSPCRMLPRPSGYCFAHDPSLAEARAEGKRRGGRVSGNRSSRVLPADTPDIPLRTMDDILVANELTYNQVRRGQIDARTGNCLAVLCQVQRRVIEGGDLARRIADLEARQPANYRHNGNGRVRV